MTYDFPNNKKTFAQRTYEKVKPGIDKLNHAWNENPLAVIAVYAMAATATAKLIDSVSAVQGRRAYAKQINMKAKRSRVNNP